MFFFVLSAPRQFHFFSIGHGRRRLLFSFSVVIIIHIFCCEMIYFFNLLFSTWLRCLRIACHLAANLHQLDTDDAASTDTYRTHGTHCIARKINSSFMLSDLLGVSIDPQLIEHVLTNNEYSASTSSQAITCAKDPNGKTKLILRKDIFKSYSICTHKIMPFRLHVVDAALAAGTALHTLSIRLFSCNLFHSYGYTGYTNTASVCSLYFAAVATTAVLQNLSSFTFSYIVIS